VVWGCDVSDSSLSGKEFCVANEVCSWGLTSKYNKYTPERAKMRRWADKNGPAKAVSQLEIASYQDLINNEAWLTL